LKPYYTLFGFLSSNSKKEVDNGEKNDSRYKNSKCERGRRKKGQDQTTEPHRAVKSKCAGQESGPDSFG
jgi:hypothetical protein